LDSGILETFLTLAHLLLLCKLLCTDGSRSNLSVFDENSGLIRIQVVFFFIASDFYIFHLTQLALCPSNLILLDRCLGSSVVDYTGVVGRLNDNKTYYSACVLSSLLYIQL
jgi:hypothetical protein